MKGIVFRIIGLLLVFGVVTIAGLTPFAQAQSISSVSGPTWGGQPARAPKSASNQYKGFLQIDTWPNPPAGDMTVWTIKGTGFGTAQGQVSLSIGITGPLPVYVHSIKSWSNTQIVIRVHGHWSFTFYRNAKVVVRTAAGRTASSAPGNWVATPKGRGFGQCTWEVFYQRMAAGLTPPPSAYPASTKIAGNYVPRQWDVLFWGADHTAIITSSPKVTTSNGQTTYSFLVTERNGGWDEAMTVTSSTFVVKNGTVVTGIKSKMSSAATSYWR